MTARAELLFRPLSEQDEAFVRDSWANCMHNRFPFSLIPIAVFGPAIRTEIGDILDKSQTLAACDPVDPDVVYGYCVYEPNTLHFCYVKNSFRRLKVAKRLLAEAGFKLGERPYFLTCLPPGSPPAAEAFLSKYQFAYVPYHILRPQQCTQRISG